MAEKTGISWCDSTLNPWIGCSHAGPGCDFCYAERDNGRFHWVEGWGPGVPRKRTGAQTWNAPLKWQRNAAEFFAEHGRRRRVFCASLADVFDNEVDQAWRDDLWALIEKCPDLNWMLVTKRIGNVGKMVPHEWLERWPVNVGLMATMVDQAEWDRDIRKLCMFQLIAPWVGVSVEPMLGPIEIGDARPDWIITGGESGPKHRPFEVGWAALMQIQCAANGIAFHHKQNGGVRGKDTGCLIDGVEYKAFPPALAA